MVVVVDVPLPLVLIAASETGRKETVNGIEKVEIGIGMPVGATEGRRAPDEKNANESEIVDETSSSQSPRFLVALTPRILDEPPILQGR